MPYDDLQLARDLRSVLEEKKVSLKTLSRDLEIPYRSLQNYISGQNRIPATILILILDRLGIDLHYLRNRDHLLRHADLYDAIWESLGDNLVEIDLPSRNRHLDPQGNADDYRRFQKKQANATALAILISEKYDSFSRRNYGTSPSKTFRQLREGAMRAEDEKDPQ